MGIGEVYFIDTATAMDYRQPKKLKEVAEKQLNAFIQDGIHSSLVDARAALAIFRKHQEVYEEYKQIMTKEDLLYSTSKHQKKVLKDYQKKKLKEAQAKVSLQQPKTSSLSLEDKLSLRVQKALEIEDEREY